MPSKANGSPLQLEGDVITRAIRHPRQYLIYDSLGSKTARKSSRQTTRWPITSVDLLKAPVHLVSFGFLVV